MIFSENRYPLFGITLNAVTACCCASTPDARAV
jgi:hypothetical protein